MDFSLKLLYLVDLFDLSTTNLWVSTMVSPNDQRTNRRMILVTGAPRTGTSPVGYVLSQSPCAVSLYEPMGPTGDERFNEEFPMPEVGLLKEKDFLAFLSDLTHLQFSPKKQNRPSHLSLPLWKKLVLKFTGTRSLHSLRIARLKFWSQTIIWKDPHAVFAVPDILKAGIPIVVTMRPPLAHAASYKRLGWQTCLQPIYERYAKKYGPDQYIERVLTLNGNESFSAVQSAAIVWRMVYSIIAKHQHDEDLHLIQSDDLERDEIETYSRIFDGLSLPFQNASHYLEARSRRSTGQYRAPKATHDWNRSVHHTNTYWKSMLSPDEIDEVNQATHDVKRLFNESSTRD